MTKGFEALIRQVEKWGIDNGLTPSPLIKAKQALCVVEETNEFAKEPSHEELGDVLVTLILLIHLHEEDPVEIFRQGMAIKTEQRRSLSLVNLAFYEYSGRIAQFARKEKKLDLMESIIDYVAFLFEYPPKFNYDPQTSLATAYDKISKRKVKKVGGSLVKETDIS